MSFRTAFARALQSDRETTPHTPELWPSLASQQETLYQGANCQRASLLPTLVSLFLLLAFDVVSLISGVKGLQRALKYLGTRRKTLEPSAVLLLPCALQMALSLYPKQAQCLQRAVVMVALLRLYGQQATVVIGVHRMPFRSHAWVELADQVINDHHTIRDLYTPLDRW